MGFSPWVECSVARANSRARQRWPSYRKDRICTPQNPPVSTRFGVLTFWRFLLARPPRVDHRQQVSRVHRAILVDISAAIGWAGPRAGAPTVDHRQQVARVHRLVAIDVRWTGLRRRSRD